MGNTKAVAECVGLWLAEGDQNSKSEITFTNNCIELIEHFINTTDLLFKNLQYNKRIYVYTSDGSKPETPFKNCQIKYYIHKRATKPYFIFRIASVGIVKKWKEIVKSLLNKNEFYPFILRGFFAGEGNIHEGKRSVRIIRISQKERKNFIDKFLNFLSLNYNFTSSNRMYNISNKRNWDIFAKYNLADLHPKKKEKFWRLYNSYKEEHYPINYLIKEVYAVLNNPTSTRELSKKFNRSFARIQDVLILLKKQGKIFNYRVGSTDYWTKNKSLIIISKLKKEYLLFLDKPKQTFEFARNFEVDWRSSFNRLKELEKLNLIEKDKTGKWIKTQTQKDILVI